MTTQGPTSERQRYLILDALRGFALLGIAIANYPEFALWTFLSDDQQTEMATGGILLFYGIGFGLGTSFGLVFVVLTAVAVFVLQTYLSRLWLRSFLFGPLEWLWRLLTYGRYFPIRRKYSGQ